MSENRYNIWCGSDKMKFNEMLKNNEYTIYALSKKSGIAKTTLFDISSGKSNIFDCSGRILLKLSLFILSIIT